MRLHNKVLKTGILILLLVSVAFTMTACGNAIAGSWTNSTAGIAVTLNFDTGGNVTVSTLGYTVVTGTYKVSGNQITLSLGSSLLSTGLSSGTSTYSISGDQLILDGLAFTKVK